MSVKYYSRHKSLQVGLKRKIIKFEPLGGAGFFETDDPKIIAELESNPNFNNNAIGGFFKGEVRTQESNVVQGIRSSSLHQKEFDLKELFKDYESLKEKIVKVDGTFRTDATDEDKEKYNSLKMEIYG